MQVTLYADSTNTKTILSLLEEKGYSLPCNCLGSHHCSGNIYPFDCSLVPQTPVTVSFPETGFGDLTGISLEDRIPVPGPGDTILIDLGTTTVALALIHRKTGELRQTCVFANPQKKYGADVISRIQASIHGNQSDLQSAIINAIREHVSDLCQINGQTTDNISHCFIAGNTVMIHLLMGYDCSPLAQSPFIPEEISPRPFFCRQCMVHILPWFSAFVGGDIAAGMYACHMEDPSAGRQPDTRLLIDLGTNGEMLLRHNNRYYSAATASGPAFEGNGLSCGCPAIPGAISGIRLMNLRPALTTIDNKLPVGICGSGAVSLCAGLLQQGYMTKEGILTERFPEKGILLGHSPSRTPLYFTAEDLRQIQLAIAATAAGIDTLTKEADISPDTVPTVFLGGGFGFYLDPDACRRTGLFSSLPDTSIQPMGNTCLRGLYRYACTSDPSAQFFLPDVHTINLADHPYFKQRFIAHMTYSG